MSISLESDQREDFEDFLHQAYQIKVEGHAIPKAKLPSLKQTMTAKFFAEKLCKTLFGIGDNISETKLKNGVLNKANGSITASTLIKIRDVISPIFESRINALDVPDLRNKEDKEELLDLKALRRNLRDFVSSVLPKDYEISKGKAKPANVGNNLLNAITDFPWYCYALHSDKTLARQILWFEHDDNKDIRAFFRFISGDNRIKKIEGSVRLTGSQQFLVMALEHPRTHDAYTHFMIKLDLSYPHLDLLIGHVTYEHPLKHPVTKTIILRKFAYPEKLSIQSVKPEEFPLSEYFLAKTSAENAIEREIVEFFNREYSNRMSSPRKKTITDIHTLKTWMHEHDKAVLLKLGLRIFEGVYSIFYTIQDDWTVQCIEYKVTIEHNGAKGLVASLEHINMSNKETVLWPGYLEYKKFKETLFIKFVAPCDSLQTLPSPQILLCIDKGNAHTNAFHIQVIVSYAEDVKTSHQALVVRRKKFTNCATNEGDLNTYSASSQSNAFTSWSLENYQADDESHNDGRPELDLTRFFEEPQTIVDVINKMFLSK